jgi:hypothetical protein
MQKSGYQTSFGVLLTSLEAPPSQRQPVLLILHEAWNMTVYAKVRNWAFAVIRPSVGADVRNGRKPPERPVGNHLFAAHEKCSCPTLYGDQIGFRSFSKGDREPATFK